jgi:hypothetical protein
MQHSAVAGRATPRGMPVLWTSLLLIQAFRGVWKSLPKAETACRDGHLFIDFENGSTYCCAKGRG